MRHGSVPCTCGLVHRSTSLIAITGGPGAGKTAILEMARRIFCRHVAVLPEAAGVVFGGGFPRRSSEVAHRAAQRAIFHIQRELEEIATGEGEVAVALCDRGTIDGLAYWPGEEAELWAAVHSSRAHELGRYHAVVHLRTPGAESGYDRSNPLRIESAREAQALDRRIEEAWSEHPRRLVIPSSTSFFDKVDRALEVIREALPPCCRTHPLPERH